MLTYFFVEVENSSIRDFCPQPLFNGCCCEECGDQPIIYITYIYKEAIYIYT